MRPPWGRKTRLALERETLHEVRGTSACNDRSEAETIELRAQDWARLITKKDIRSDIPFVIKKARDGDRTRDPLLGKEVLHR